MVRELVHHQVAADHLVIEVPLLEHLVVEEMPERSVTDVVEESRDPERLLDQCRRRRVREGATQRSIDTAGEETREVHRTEQVGEPRMLGAWKHPPRGLQLVDSAEALQPDRVE